MTTHSPVGAGFAEPVNDAQQTFRVALDALSRPGQRGTVERDLPGTDLGQAMAHLLLALTDDDTAVWWQQAKEAPAHWLRFHTGARTAAAPRDAAFACITVPASMPGLGEFAQGCTAAPEQSTTLLIELPALDGGPALQWHGPGIRDACTVGLAGLAADFWTQWQHNHAGFPRGVDVIFTCGSQAIGLPRTTRASRLEGL